MPRVRDRSSLAEAVRSPLRRLRADYREWTALLRGLPSALIIGAQRSGSMPGAFDGTADASPSGIDSGEAR
jgi:hypothetical protein